MVKFTYCNLEIYDNIAEHDSPILKYYVFLQLVIFIWIDHQHKINKVILLHTVVKLHCLPMTANGLKLSFHALT